MSPNYKMLSSKIISVLCFIVVLVPVNLSNENKDCNIRARLTTLAKNEKFGIGRGPGIFNNVPKFTRPFRIISKPAARPYQAPPDAIGPDFDATNLQVTPILGPIPENFTDPVNSAFYANKTTNSSFEIVQVPENLTVPDNATFEIMKVTEALSEDAQVSQNLTATANSELVLIKSSSEAPSKDDLLKPGSLYQASIDEVGPDFDKFSLKPAGSSMPVNLTYPLNPTFDVNKMTEAPSEGVQVPVNLTASTSLASEDVHTHANSTAPAAPIWLPSDDAKNINVVSSEDLHDPSNLTVSANFATNPIEGSSDIKPNYHTVTSASSFIPANWTAHTRLATGPIVGYDDMKTDHQVDPFENSFIPANFSSDINKSSINMGDNHRVASSESSFIPVNWTAPPSQTSADMMSDLQTSSSESVFIPANWTASSYHTSGSSKGSTYMKPDLQVPSSDSVIFPTNWKSPADYRSDTKRNSTEMKSDHQVVPVKGIYIPSDVTTNLTSPSDLIKTTIDVTTIKTLLEGDEPGTGRNPGLFDLFPKFTRPFKIISKPSATTPNQTTQNSAPNSEKDEQQAGGSGVQIPANLTLPLPVSVGGTTTADPDDAGIHNTQVTSSTTEEGTWLGQIKYPCACTGGTCGCCTGRILSNFNINVQQRGCVNVTYYNEDFEFQVRMIWNDRVFYQRRMSGKNPPPLCIPLPRLVNLKFCVKFSNIYMIGRNMHMCLDIEGLLAEYQVFATSFECFRLGTNGFAVVSPEDGGGLGPPPEEDPYVPPAKPIKPPKPPKPQSGNKPKPPKPGQIGSVSNTSTGNKPKPGTSATTEDYDAIVASEGDEIDSAKSAIQL